MEWHNEKTNQTMLYVALGVVRLEKAELSAMAFRWYRGKGRLGTRTDRPCSCSARTAIRSIQSTATTMTW